MAELLRDYINETTDEEALEIWQMIAKADPNIALKIILDKSEKLNGIIGFISQSVIVLNSRREYIFIEE